MTCKECAQRHPDILHVEKEDSKDATMSTNQDSGNSQNEEVSCAQVSITQESCGHTGAEEIGCMLSIVPVKVKSRKSARCIETYAFMDPGSTATFCTEEIQNRLNVKGKPTQISLSTMSQGESGGPKLFNSYMLSDLEVCGLEDTKYIELPRVFTHKNIPVKKENIPREAYIHKWSYLRGVRLPHIDAEVGLLIGADSSKAMELWHIINSQEDGPYAVKTALGWTVSGPFKSENDKPKNDKTLPHYCVNRISEEDVEQLLILQYNADFPERHYDDREEMSLEDKQFMQSVQKTIKFVDGHYCIGLPLRHEIPKVPNNHCMAEQRATSLLRKLKRNEEFLEDYKGFMKNMIKNSYAVAVPQEQLKRDDGRGVSLNGELLQGPDLTNTLIGALMRFREEPVAIVADIESMFYQVKVPEGDTDLLQFLWWPDGNLNAHLEEFRMTVHIFGATSSPSCVSYALRRTAEDRRSIAAPEAVETVLHNIYVDDCLKSVCSEEQAIALVKDLRDLCAQGGFCLTKWVNNSRKVLSTIPAEHRASNIKDLDLNHDALPTERALGVQWCTDSDTFMYNIRVQEKPVTRRGILSVVGSIYDPLGFLASFILPAKLLLRDLCKDKHGWDEELTAKHADRWCKWQDDLTHLSALRINRCVKPLDFGRSQEQRVSSTLRLSSKAETVKVPWRRVRTAQVAQDILP
ncbi:hypothetical protein SRHO_G00202610 [Serrasalmus rhombeus]